MNALAWYWYVTPFGFALLVTWFLASVLLVYADVRSARAGMRRRLRRYRRAAMLIWRGGEG